MKRLDGVEPGQVWEWTGFVDSDNVRVTLLVLEVVLDGHQARCVTLSSAHEGIWPPGEQGVWGLSGPDRYRRIA